MGLNVVRCNHGPSRTTKNIRAQVETRLVTLRLITETNHDHTNPLIIHTFAYMYSKFISGKMTKTDLSVIVKIKLCTTGINP